MGSRKQESVFKIYIKYFESLNLFLIGSEPIHVVNISQSTS
jgi:hypothetical protein